MSAIHPPEAGLVALPNNPFKTLAATNNIKRIRPVNFPAWPTEIVKLKRIKEIASLISGKEITNAGIKQAEILLEDG